MPPAVGVYEAVVLADVPAERPLILEPPRREEVLMRKRLGKDPFAGPAAMLEMSEERAMLCPTLGPEGEIVGVAAVRSEGHDVLDGAVEEQEPLHCQVPLDCVWPQAFPPETQVVPYAFPPGMVTAGEIHVPLPSYVPFVCPHALADDVHAPPLHPALLGAVDEQEPLHWVVPLAWVWPQTLAGPEQAEPYPDGLAGAVDEQEPSHWMVPVLVAPQAFAADEHEAPSFASQDGPDAAAGAPSPHP